MSNFYHASNYHYLCLCKITIVYMNHLSYSGCIHSCCHLVQQDLWLTILVKRGKSKDSQKRNGYAIVIEGICM